MKNLLRKEFNLAIHPLYLAAGFVFGALALIPQWVYLLIPLYFCWITVPTLMGQYKSNKDNEFSALLPVPRRSVVGARVLAFVILELLHVIGVAVFTVVHNRLYSIPNFGIDLGLGYLGVVLFIYAVFNIVFFPMYYRTAQKFGFPLILAVAITLIIAGAAEALVLVSPVAKNILEGSAGAGAVVLLAAAAFFVASGYVTFLISAKRYETVQL